MWSCASRSVLRWGGGLGRVLTGVLVVVAVTAVRPVLADSESRGNDARDSASTEIIVVGAFSAAEIGASLPSGWEPLVFKKIPRATQYDVIEEGATRVLRARSQNSASGLVRKLAVDVKRYPILHWRWKVDRVIAKGDLRTKEGDDYPARIYVTFAYDPAAVDFTTRMKYRVGRLLFGELPVSALNYIWDTTAPLGTVADSSYTDLSKMIVVESGPERTGEWVEETRNIYEDFLSAFGREPSPVNGIAVMTDTDNTGETATAYYGDIFMTVAP
jgi:hypothetical protein